MLFIYSLRPLWQFFIFSLLSVVLIFTNPADKLSPVRMAAASLMEVVADFTGYLVTNQQLRNENQLLKQRLVQEIFLKNFYQNCYQENLRLKSLLGLRELPGFHFIYAGVIGTSPYKGLQVFVINKGENDSVNVNDVVIAREGLIGKVIEAFPHQAVVQILRDRNLKISAKIYRNNERGILRYFSNDLLLLDFIPKTIEIIPGDVVITAETSETYPPGIKIGKVVSIEKKPEEHFQRIFVSPFVNFDEISEVIVLKVQHAK